jgi:hypothetical protein
MSAARADNAARDLLARLIDEAELEAAPLDKVRADLALLDIDPERAIRFGRRLAAEAGSPAAGLLAKAHAAEDVERELAALESAGIDAVRADLAASAPLATEQAKRLAGVIAQAAPQRRGSRRLWYGIGGAVTAIAASVLIVVQLSNEADPQLMAYAPENELASTTRGELEQPDASSKSAAPASSVPIAGGVDSGAVPVSNADALSDGAASRFEQQYDAITGMAATDRARQEAAEIQPNDAGGATAAAGYFRGPLPVPESEFANLVVSAALILQPEQAPEPLRQSDLGSGELASRLPEVARLPFNQYVIALVTLERADGTTIDGMLFHLPVGQFQALRKSDADVSLKEEVPLEENESSPLVEPIGAEPNLRQLLGEQDGDFRLVTLNPPAAAGQQ